jgi:2-polyprenyl-3-methyl-5-hydroxy-6-metoxy-1,4-benzoquinol methylase
LSDERLSEYAAREADTFLHRFSIHNPGVQDSYSRLLEQAMDSVQPADVALEPAYDRNLVASEGGLDNYLLPRGYRSRTRIMHWDDTTIEDEDQVYAFAHRIATDRKYRRIADFGCGSGFKLIKYFDGFDTTGYEIEPTLSFIRDKYPERKWKEGTFAPADFDGYDMVICSDVIEHLPQPEKLLEVLAQSSAKTVMLSTPALEVMSDWDGCASRRFGPPGIPTHFREWSTYEFGNFVVQYLPVSEHHVLDVYQATRVLFSDRDPDYQQDQDGIPG